MSEQSSKGSAMPASSTVAVLAALSVSVAAFIFCSRLVPGGKSSPSPDNSLAPAFSAQLPPYQVSEIEDTGKMVTFFLVVDKAFSVQDARKVIAHYWKDYQDYNFFNVYFYCDWTYAADKYFWDLSVPDEVIMSHVLYWYHKGKMGNIGTRFVTAPDPYDYPTLGSACR